MELAWTPRRQGDAGEFSAMVWLHDAGAIVCKPLFEHPDYDLIADFGDRIHRVQVPAMALGGGSGIVLGGARYAEYEIEPGTPLQARPPPALTISG